MRDKVAVCNAQLCSLARLVVCRTEVTAFSYTAVAKSCPSRVRYTVRTRGKKSDVHTQPRSAPFRSTEVAKQTRTEEGNVATNMAQHNNTTLEGICLHL